MAENADLQNADLTELLGAIAADTKKLIEQQCDLLRAEVGQEVRRAATAAASIATGSGMLAAGGPSWIGITQRWNG